MRNTDFLELKKGCPIYDKEVLLLDNSTVENCFKKHMFINQQMSNSKKENNTEFIDYLYEIGFTEDELEKINRNAMFFTYMLPNYNSYINSEHIPTIWYSRIICSKRFCCFLDNYLLWNGIKAKDVTDDEIYKLSKLDVKYKYRFM